MKAATQTKMTRQHQSATLLQLALQRGKQGRKLESPEKAALAAGKRIVAAMKKAREET